MANYYGQFRSNYFHVKDVEAFKAWADRVDVRVLKKETNQMWMVCSSDMSDSGGIPDTEDLPTGTATKPPGWTDEEFADEFRQFDFLKELSQHLAKYEIAIVMETGSEKLRYLHGWAGAINSEGKRLEVSISDIYKKAIKKFNKVPTRAEY